MAPGPKWEACGPKASLAAAPGPWAPLPRFPTAVAQLPPWAAGKQTQMVGARAACLAPQVPPDLLTHVTSNNPPSTADGTQRQVKKARGRPGNTKSPNPLPRPPPEFCTIKLPASPCRNILDTLERVHIFFPQRPAFSRRGCWCSADLRAGAQLSW